MDPASLRGGHVQCVLLCWWSVLVRTGTVCHDQSPGARGGGEHCRTASTLALDNL